MQRCFQLSDLTAASLLPACAADGSMLGTLCLSHMNLGQPRADLFAHGLTGPPAQPAAFSSLQILALHNSVIVPQALDRVLKLCPRLLLLMLGGCTLASQQAVVPLPPAAVNPTDGAQTQALLASLGCPLGPGSSMGAAVQALSEELSSVLAASSVRVLEVTHWLPSMVAGLEVALASLGSVLATINLRQPGAVQVRQRCWEALHVQRILYRRQA